jgi:hypothetical protein
MVWMLQSWRTCWAIKHVFLFFYLASCAVAHTEVLRIDHKIAYLYGVPAVKMITPEGNFTIIIDTGGIGTHFPLDVLKKYGKITSEFSNFSDISGNTYTVPIWNLKEINIFNTSFKNINVLEDVAFGLSASDESPMDQMSGSLGLDVFMGKVVYMDFVGHTIHIDTPSKAPLSKGSWFDFTLSSNGIEFEIKIQQKKLKAIIDTGSTCSFIRPDALDSKWKLEENDIIPLKNKGITHYVLPFHAMPNQELNLLFSKDWKIFVYQFNPSVDIIIGMDFLKGKNIILDLKNNKLGFFHGMPNGKTPY